MIEIKDAKSEIRLEIAKILAVEESEITDEAHFVEDLGMDSLQALELLVRLEKRYNVKLSQEALRQFKSLTTTAEAILTFVGKAQVSPAS